MYFFGYIQILRGIFDLIIRKSPGGNLYLPGHKSAANELKRHKRAAALSIYASKMF